MEELLTKILEELKNISEIESGGPDGDVLFNKLDIIALGISNLNSKIDSVNSRVESLEADITRIAENTDN